MGKAVRAVWSALHTDPYPIGLGQVFESTEDALYWGAARDQNFSENFLVVLAKEKQYRAAKREYDQYQTWLRERNPTRAEMEKKFGFDCKHAMHLVRLVRTCEEILTDEVFLTKRPDAKELLGIRNGDWTFEEIVEFMEKKDKELDILVKKSKLPKVPDMKFFDNMVREMVLEFNK